MNIICACKPSENIQCVFHARAPRPCPACATAGRDGITEFYTGKSGGVVRVYASTDGRGYMRRDSGTFERHEGKARMCNTCDYAEVVK